MGVGAITRSSSTCTASTDKSPASGAAALDDLRHQRVGRATHDRLARAVDHDEADLAGLGLLVQAHQLDVAVGAQLRADDGQAGGLRWYGWLLIGIATVLVLYAMGYLIHNFTRPLRRRRRSQRL